MKQKLLQLFALLLCCSACWAQKSQPFVISSSSSPCAQIAIAADRTATVTIDVSGTFSITLQPQVSLSGGTAHNTDVTPSASQTPQATITAAGGYQATQISGWDLFQVCPTSYSSGSATITLSISTGPDAIASTSGGGSGTVTSVTFTGDGVVDSSTPSSAVTTSGTVAATIKTQTANTVLAGPSSGSAAASAFRALVGADLPVTVPCVPSNGVYCVDNFTTANYPGIGVAQTAWSSGTYALCTNVGYTSASTAWSITGIILTVTVNNSYVAGNQVTFTSPSYNGGTSVSLTVIATGLSSTQFEAFTGLSGSATEAGTVLASYMATGTTTGVTPGTNSAVWFQVPFGGAAPTALDCADAIALSAMVNAASPNYGPVLQFGAVNGYYYTNYGVQLAPANWAGSDAISLQGAGPFNTNILLNTNIGTTNGAVYLPVPTGGGNNPKRFFVKGMTIWANSNSLYPLQILGQHYDSQFSDLVLRTPAAGGAPIILGASGVATESGNQDVFTNILIPATRNATCAPTATVSGSTPTIVITGGSSGCDANLKAWLVGYQGGTALNPCSSIGAVTVVQSGGVVTSATSTATGCSGTYYVVFDDDPIQYGMQINNITDSSFNSMTVQSGWEAGVLTLHGNNAFYKLHSYPYGKFCFENNAQNTVDSFQMGECSLAEIDTAGTGPTGITTMTGTPEYGGAVTTWQGQVVFRNELSGNRVYAHDMYCGAVQTNEFHTLVTPSGTIDTNAQLVGSGNSMDNVQYCGSGTGGTLTSNAAASALTSGSTAAGNFLLTGTLVTNVEYSNGTCTTSKTINPSNGNRQSVTLTASDTCAFTWSQPSSQTTAVQLKITSPASGTGQISGGYWPSGSGFTTTAPTLTATGSVVVFATCYLDGTNAYCALSQ